MKPIHMEFVPNRSWRLVWALSAVLALVILLLAGVKWQGRQQGWERESQAQRSLRAQIDALSQPSQPLPAMQVRARQQVNAQLQLDLNPVFATVEGLQLPGVQLRSLNVDTSNGVVRLEYALDSVAQASQVSEKLNTGYDRKPWGLTAVVMNAAAGSGGTAAVAGAGIPVNRVGGSYSGTWSASIDRL